MDIASDYSKFIFTVGIIHVGNYNLQILYHYWLSSHNMAKEFLIEVGALSVVSQHISSNIPRQIFGREWYVLQDICAPNQHVLTCLGIIRASRNKVSWYSLGMTGCSMPLWMCFAFFSLAQHTAWCFKPCQLCKFLALSHIALWPKNAKVADWRSCHWDVKSINRKQRIINKSYIHRIISVLADFLLLWLNEWL